MFRENKLSYIFLLIFVFTIMSIFVFSFHNTGMAEDRKNFLKAIEIQNLIISTLSSRIEMEKDSLKYVLTEKWKEYKMNELLRDAIDRATEKVIGELGYLYRLFLVMNKDSIKDVSEKILIYTMEDSTFREKMKSYTKEVLTLFIAEIITSDRVGVELLSSYFFNILNVDKKDGIKKAKEILTTQIISCTTPSYVFDIPVLRGLTIQLISRIVRKPISRTISHRINRVLRVMPLIGQIIIIWDLTHPNTTIYKIRNFLKQDKNIKFISSQIMETLFTTIVKTLEYYIEELDVTYPTSKNL